jgi:serine/threonine protein kinase
MIEVTIFAAALGKPTPEERAAYVVEACAGDEELRRRVEALLRAHASADDAPGPPEPRVHTVDYTPVAERPGTRVGPYRLLEQIGEGGFGLVFVAEQQEPVRRKVALKVIKPGMDSRQVIARFEAERQALALMDHPNIARVLDAGATQSGGPYFVMELVRGIPITDYCDQHQLTPRERLELFVTVCNAIQHAHQKGIIHRDVKPSNVLVTSHDGKPVAKVIDFGVAKALHQHLTERTIYTNFAQMVGTPLYMSPEQAEMSGLDVDTRSDIYSLGVLLYELLTGTTPLEKRRFARAAYDEIRRLIREEEPPRPSQRLSTSEALPKLAASRKVEPAKLPRMMRGELDWIVMKALEKDRTRRYESASGLARDVQRYLADETVEACPPSAGYRLRKFARKHRTALTSAVMVTLLLLAGIAVSAWQAVRATRAEGLAVAERDAKEQARAAEAEQRHLAVAQQGRALAAEAEAKAQAKEAKDRLALATALTQFLQNDLLGQAGSKAQADRQFEPDYNLTIKEALDRAATAVGNRFKDRQELEASIRHTMGDAYREVGDFEHAIIQLQQAAAIRKGKLGPEHADTLATLGSLALALEAAGRTTEAIALLEQVRDVQVKTLGPNHSDTLATLGSLAFAYMGAGRPTQAIALLEGVRDAQAKQFGPDHASTLTTLGILALAHRSDGNMAEAIDLLEKVRVARAKSLGPHHPDTLETLSNLAETYRLDGKTAEPIALLEEVRDARVKDLGPDHPDTLLTLNHLAAAYWQAKRLDKSIPLFEKTLALMRKKLGEQHPQTLRTQANLGVNYRDAGRLAEAIPLLEQAHREAGKHALLRWVGSRLAVAYIRAGRATDAAALVKENLASVRGWHPADSLRLATALAENGSALLELQTWPDAEAVLREALAIFEKKQPQAWTTFSTRAALGSALLGQKRYADAEPLLLAGYEGMKQRDAKIPPQGKVRLTATLEQLVRLYGAWDKPEEAAKWRKRLEDPGADTIPP